MTDTQRLQKNIQALVGKPAQAKTLGARYAAPPLPTAVGAARPKLAGSNTPGSGGIAGPLSEPDAAQRTYHAAYTTMTTSDGLFSVRIHHPDTFKMVDGIQREFDLTLDAP